MRGTERERLSPLLMRRFGVTLPSDKEEILADVSLVIAIPCHHLFPCVIVHVQ